MAVLFPSTLFLRNYFVYIFSSALYKFYFVYILSAALYRSFLEPFNASCSILILCLVLNLVVFTNVHAYQRCLSHI